MEPDQCPAWMDVFNTTAFLHHYSTKMSKPSRWDLGTSGASLPCMRLHAARLTPHPQVCAATSPERCRAKAKQSKGHAGSTAFWDALSGWKAVDVGDDILLGAEEGGFAGLEVLEDVSVLDPELMKALDAAAAGHQQSGVDARAAPAGKAAAAQPKDSASKKKAAQQQKQQQKQQQADKVAAAQATRKRGTAAADGEGEEGDVEALRAKLLALEAENAALKKGGKRQKVAAAAAGSGAISADGGDVDPAAAAAAVEAAAAKQLKRKQKAEVRMQKQRQLKAAKREQAKQEKQQAAQQAQEAAAATAAAAAAVDMSAWAPYCLAPQLERALALQRFSSPTPIQQAAMLPAMRDRRDVIGAAETGSGKTLAFGLPVIQLLLQERAAAAEAAAAGPSASGAQGEWELGRG